jgi:hypothetical protein
MGLSTALYRRSLLSIDNVDLLPSSQSICFAFGLNCFLSVLMCFAHVSFLSKCMPSISLHSCGVDSPFAVSDRFGCVR